MSWREREEFALDDHWDSLVRMSKTLPERCACPKGETGVAKMIDSAVGFSDSAIIIWQCVRCGKVFSRFVEG